MNQFEIKIIDRKKQTKAPKFQNFKFILFANFNNKLFSFNGRLIKVVDLLAKKFLTTSESDIHMIKLDEFNSFTSSQKVKFLRIIYSVHFDYEIYLLLDEINKKQKIVMQSFYSMKYRCLWKKSKNLIAYLAYH